MKKILVTTGLFVALACAATVSKPPVPVPPGIVLEAQSLPATIYAQFDAPAASMNATGAILTVDGTPQTVSPLPTAGQTCACVDLPFTLSTAGSHTVTVAFTNQTLSTDATSSSTGPVSTVTFTLNAPVSTPPGHATVVQKKSS